MRREEMRKEKKKKRDEIGNEQKRGDKRKPETRRFT